MSGVIPQPEFLFDDVAYQGAAGAGWKNDRYHPPPSLCVGHLAQAFRC
jgi:hypothetical protein